MIENHMKKDRENAAIIRHGPRPLMTHLGLMVSAKMHKGVEELNPQDVSDFLCGVQKYQRYPFIRRDQEGEVHWNGAGTRLYKIVAITQTDKQPVFIIPSMINSYTILDLLPQQSFCRWLAEQGRDVYILDWGNMAACDDIQDMDDVFTHIIAPALQSVNKVCNAAPHVIGYCMGGVLALAQGSAYPGTVRSITALATPWDFAAAENALGQWVRFWAPTGLQMIAQMGYLPANWIQTVFASLDPFQMEQKFSQFGKSEAEKHKEHIFVCVEDWLNEAVDLPGPLARDCIENWFLNNALQKGEWTVRGQAINLDNITCPIAVVASKKDRLVPYASSQAIAECCSAAMIEADCGHIGYMASQRAKENIWPNIEKFITTHD